MLVIEIMIFVIGSQIQNELQVGILVLVIGVLSFVIVRKSRMLVIYYRMTTLQALILPVPKWKTGYTQMRSPTTRRGLSSKLVPLTHNRGCQLLSVPPWRTSSGGPAAGWRGGTQSPNGGHGATRP